MPCKTVKERFPLRYVCSRPFALIISFALFAGVACSQSDQDTRERPPDAGTRTGTGTTTVNDDSARVVLFLGTSLTAGYGVGEDAAYPALLQQKMDSAGLPYRVINAGLSGETSAGGLRRLDWSLQTPIDVLVIELGANDGLRGLEIDALRANLDSIITRTRRRYPETAIVVLGMEAPPNMGRDYAGRFRDTFRNVARERDARLVPFLLDRVAGQQSLNLEDGIHPNAEGHRILAETVWKVLGPILTERAHRL